MLTFPLVCQSLEFKKQQYYGGQSAILIWPASAFTCLVSLLGEFARKEPSRAEIEERREQTRSLYYHQLPPKIRLTRTGRLFAFESGGTDLDKVRRDRDKMFISMQIVVMMMNLSLAIAVSCPTMMMMMKAIASAPSNRQPLDRRSKPLNQAIAALVLSDLSRQESKRARAGSPWGVETHPWILLIDRARLARFHETSACCCTNMHLAGNRVGYAS